MTVVADGPRLEPAHLDRLRRMPTGFVCSGCGFVAPPERAVPMRCPDARPGDDMDHVLRRTIKTEDVAFPMGAHASPFETYRELFHAFHVIRALGATDAEYIDVVRRLDRAIAAVDGHGFVPTPLVAPMALRARLGMSGEVVVKDETGNVGGSHKARHLAGTALEIDAAARLPGGPGARAPLAIASCGNAALAAAVVAAAWGRELQVFVPPTADPSILGRLRELGARLAIVARPAGEPGDPTYRALRDAIAGGALPFTCQGNENGFAIEGGETLGYELVSDLAARGLTLDRLFVQVGGGALASSVSQALEEALALGVIARLPRIHAVQSRNVQPLVRAYRRVVESLAPRFGAGEDVPGPGSPPAAWRRLADRLRDAVAEPTGAAALAAVPGRRSAWMWPWENEPHSVAEGIIDDETYDWFAVVRAMVRTGGFPVAATETALEAASELGREATGIDVDATGTAGLAGLMTLRDAGEVEPDETVGLLFTGVRRTTGIGEHG